MKTIVRMFSLSSKQWIARQTNDIYMQKAKEDNYRSRAAYKLIEMDKQYHILPNKAKILELGSTPGGWTQYISRKYTLKDCHPFIYAIDINLMENVRYLSDTRS